MRTLLAAITFIMLLGCLSFEQTSVNGSKPDKSGFCGASSYGSCSSDVDCVRGGCSNNLCHSTSETPPVTTCEYRECYSAGEYGVECGCVDGQCQWQ